MYQIKKRSGELELFELSKIKSAIKRTFDSCNRNYQESIIETISIKSVADAETKIKDNVLSVEDIQDSVEKVLMTYGYEDVAKAYILYRKQHERVRNAKDTLLNYKNVIESYIDKSDWRVKENSSIDYSLGGLILGNSGAVTANYWLSEIYDEEIANAHRNCDMHIHDLSMLSGYCFTGDTKVAVIKQEFEKDYIESYTNIYDERIDYSEFVSFEDLIKSGRKKPYVIAHTGKEDEFEVVQADDIRVTRYVDEVIELTFHTLCYGDITIKSTLDHPYLVEKVSSSGSEYSYVKASELCENDNVVGLEYDIGGGYNEYHVQLKESKIVKLDKSIPVYDLTVPKYHNFLIEGDIFVHNCAGWSLKTLIKEGFGGVPRKISSAPAKHLSTLCNQMINFLGTMSLEWSGAQAFNSVDTLLAPFVKVDNLSYKEVYQCIQSLVFGLNTPSRWGCVSTNTEVLSENGFKKYDELKEGDRIYTFKDGRLELNTVNKVVIKEFSGKLHSYRGRNYIQTVTPDHRVLVRKHNSNECVIKRSEEIFNVKTPYALPLSFNSSEINNNELNDDLITLAAMVYTDGSFDFRNGVIHKVTIYKSPNRFGNEELSYVLNSLGLKYSFDCIDSAFGKVNKYTLYGDSARFIVDLCGNKTSIDSKFMKMSKSQAELFLHIWASFDGDEDKQLCQYDNDVIRDQLQQIAVLSGRCSYIVKDELKSGKTTNYVKIRKVNSIYPTSREEVDYSGTVWCPSVDNGTAVFRENGCVFISGQCQPPFTNFTLDWTVPDDLAEMNCIVGGKEVDFKYKDCKREMDMINKAFIEVMLNGDEDGRSFAYPIPTYSITKDFDWDTESPNNKLLFEMTAKYGIPYFSNYINSDLQPDSVRAMCCRLRLDLRELRRKSGGYFGSGDNTGSIGVVTINMPRLAYTSKTKDEFYSRLTKLMDIAARSLKIKRNVITQYLDQGLYPYTKRYLGSFNDHFSTIGIVGMNECCLNANWIKDSIVSSEGYKFTKEVLDFMRNKLSDYQEQYGDLYNFEATPAEGVTHRFASHDKKDFPDIITAGDKTEGAPYYTNSSNLPVGYTDDIFEALDHQDELQTRYTGGTVFHAFLGEKLPSWQAAMNLTRKIVENYKLQYVTFSPTYSICQEHGYLVGEQWKCPHCGRDTEVYSRVTGYYRAVQNFNDGKAHEFKDRKEYTNFSREFKSTPVQTKEQEVNEPEDIKLERPILFTTSTCPNCKIVKQLLAEYDFVYDLVVADQDMETARKFDINQAPTLVVQDEDGNLIKIANVSNIKKFIEEAMADIEE